MGERKKPPFKWEPRQREPDDPMFGKVHVAAIRFPGQPELDDHPAEREQPAS